MAVRKRVGIIDVEPLALTSNEWWNFAALTKPAKSITAVLVETGQVRSDAIKQVRQYLEEHRVHIGRRKAWLVHDDTIVEVCGLAARLHQSVDE